MTEEELKKLVLQDADNALGAPGWAVSPAQKKRVRAMRAALDEDAVVIAAIHARYEQIREAEGGAG
jgi:hypothetical protein